ncbi:MAG: pseudouridine synthase [Pseudomonadota bacterium]
MERGRLKREPRQMPLGPMRLARMIALSSELSRRAAEAAIAAGRVTVGGEAATKQGTTVDPAKDRICLDGRELRLAARRHYLAFYKPLHVLVTKSDPQCRPTIWDHLEEWKKGVNSVGRLDFDSEGLILLSDDGDFINRLTHPRHEVWKIYRVRIKGAPTNEELNRLRSGLKLKDGMTLPARVKRIDHGDSNALIEIGIREGRNRQVRRMFDELGFPVIRLKRTSVGPIVLGRLKPGEWRHLKGEEVNALLRQSGT